MSEPKVTGWANKCNQLFIYVNHLMTRVARPEPGFFIGRSREPEPPLLVDLLGKQKKKNTCSCNNPEFRSIHK